MAQFYINATDYEADLRRCKESFVSGEPITITGAKSNGSIGAFTGVVKSIEDNGEEAPPSRRFKVTIRE